MTALAARAETPVSRPTPVAGLLPFEPFIDKFEVAKRLELHFSTIERLVKSKSDALPVYRIGPADKRQKLRFRWSEIEAWLIARHEGGAR